jgi:phosphoglucosamine mutase
MHPEILAQNVIENKADFGIALDGDADRIMVVNEKGEVASGDQLLALIATYLKKRSLLSKNAIVATIMSNGNLDRYLDTIGISTIRTRVGDKYVSDEMTKSGINFGGENSGHIIIGDFGSTGDGLAVGLLVATILRQSRIKASEVFKVFEEMPQAKDEVWYDKTITDLQWDIIQTEVDKRQQQIKPDGGSVVVRRSGTEKKVRIMVEHNDIKLAKAIVVKIGDVIKKTIK